MTQVFRLIKRKWVNQAFDGEGAKRYGGRWNSKGAACVYCAGSESLALLEVLVHVHEPINTDHFVLFELTLPDDQVMLASPSVLPNHWRDEPAPAETADFGDTWMSSGQSLGLAVPSVVVPREWNYLLNVTHPLYQDVIATARELEIEVDARLL